MDNQISYGHLAPKLKYVLVYYSDGYTVLNKRFSDLNYANPFVEKLMTNPDFHLVEVRVVTEKKVIAPFSGAIPLRTEKVDKTKVEEAFTYHAPNETQIKQMQMIREKAKELAYLIFEECPASADRTAALRKLRETVTTANSSIILNGII